MVIQRSSSAQTARLIDDLIGADPVRREAAVARLAIVGERAVDRLLLALDSASPHTVPAASAHAALAVAGVSDATEASRSPDATIVILRTLELIGSPRALPAAISRLDASNDAIAIAAVGAIRPHLRAADDAVVSQSLEALTALALAQERSDPPRLAALEALGDMGAETLQPIRDRLRQDPSTRVRRAAGFESESARSELGARVGRGGLRSRDRHPGEGGRRATGDVARSARAGPRTGPRTAETTAAHLDPAVAELEAAARGELPEEPATLRALITAAGGTVALSVLHDLVLTLRLKERAPSTSALDWMAARGAAHQALAERHSRLAVFDLRDTFEHATERLPLGFVGAMTEVGDASCLPALAAAWRQVNDGWMRDHLASAFQAIMMREGLTRRHAAVRRALERAPDSGTALIKAPARSGRQQSAR